MHSMKLAEELKQRITGEVTDDPSTLEKYSEDTSIFHIKPACVVVPKNSDDLRALIQFAGENPGVSLTARSAGTDMSGGPLNDSVIVCMTEHFNRIIEVGEDYAIAQPGVFYRDFEKATLQKGLLLPCYTASRELNTVGGMVANNSAGEKSLTYGKTDKYVRELKVMLRDGNEYVFRKLNRQELEEKKSLQTFEGQIYRDVDWLIHERIDTIRAGKPIVSKNSAGYAIWNVWNEAEDTFDLTQLFVGSQGTLGLITEITFKLVKPKTHSRMLILFLRPHHMSILGELVNTVLREKPESFESYDDKTFGVMLRVLPQLMKRLGGNVFTLPFSFLPEARMFLTGGIPKLVLMAEFTGDSEAEVIAAAERAQDDVRARFTVASHVTRSQKEGDKYWIIRRESFNLLRNNVHEKHTAPFIDDISVRPEYLPEFLPKLYAIMAQYKIIFTIAGHIGDGNFHIIPLMDFSRPDFVTIIRELSNRVYALVGEYHGSITGEHNDGLIRTPFLDRMFSPQMLSLFADLKKVFDPQGIFNPHKKVDGDMDLLFRSIKHEVRD